MIIALYIIFITILVLLDQFAKRAVVQNMALGESIEIIKGFFSLTYVRNYGAGFSILQNATFFLLAMTVIACGALFYLLLKSDEKDLYSKMSYLLIISGAMGNFIDRIRYGYVVDFLDFKIFGYNYPVFNVADCFVTVGCFMLIFRVLWESKRAKNRSDS